MFLTEKRDGSIKAGEVYNGKPTRQWLQREDSASPTASLEKLDTAWSDQCEGTTGYNVRRYTQRIYPSKTESATATSSTKAEFLAAVTDAKHAKYLRAVLLELGYAQDGPTPLYEDNMSVINMNLLTNLEMYPSMMVRLNIVTRK